MEIRPKVLRTPQTGHLARLFVYHRYVGLLCSIPDIGHKKAQLDGWASEAYEYHLPNPL
jgi:hypothetical protein